MSESAQSSVPATQRAWVLHKTGGHPRDILKLEDCAVPTPTGKQLLVRVHAAALNPYAYKAMTKSPLSLLMKTPAIPESDFSGVVVGGAVEGTGFNLGQEVFGIVPGNDVVFKGTGSLCQYVAVEPALIAPKPANITHDEGASFPLAGLTAYYALVRQAGLMQGDGKRVLINGGSGGVGAWAIQIAKSKGAYVVSTCSPATGTFVTSLGADATIDYRAAQPSLAAHLTATYPLSGTPNAPFDVVLDAVGSDVDALLAASPAFLAPHGMYVDVAGSAEIDGLWSTLCARARVAIRALRPAWLGGTARKYRFFLLPTPKMTEELLEAADRLASGTLKPIVGDVFSFENALDAYDKIMSGRAMGKIIVHVD